MFAAIPADAQPVEVNTCGQTVGKEGGFLSADLDCSSFEGASILLSGRLTLNGHTVTGNAAASGDARFRAAVRCPEASRCEIVGPGLLTGGEDGVFVEGKGCLVAGVTVADNAHAGIDGHTKSRIEVVDSLITRNGRIGISPAKKVRGSSIVFNGAADFLFSAGLATRNGAKVEDTDISDNFGVGVTSNGSTRSTFKRVTVRRNELDGFSGAGARFKVVESFVEDNGGSGFLTTDSVKISDTTVSGNVASGVAANQRLIAKRSDVTGNCLLGFPGCFDLLTCSKPPKVKDVQCEISGNCSGIPWGVCTFD